MDTLSVFIAQIPRKTNVTALSHPLRQSQIDSCKSNKVKEEKFYVWKLLEYAVFSLFNKPLTDFNITLDKTGKWLSNGFEFSLSHSNGVVAVAISPYPVGVDVELIKKPKVNVYGKVFNDKQLIEFNRLPEDEKAEYFITKWANKDGCKWLAGQAMEDATMRSGVIHIGFPFIAEVDNKDKVVDLDNSKALEEQKLVEEYNSCIDRELDEYDVNTELQGIIDNMNVYFNNTYKFLNDFMKNRK